MRNALFTAAIATALFAAPVAVMAEGISYNYVDARYFSTDSDALSVNLQGGTLAASYALGPIFYIVADGQYAQSEKITVGTNSGRFDVFAGSARIGVHHEIAPTLDIIANAGALYNEFKGKGAFSGNKDDDIGYIGEVGLRLALVPLLEVGAFYNYSDVLDDTSSSFTGELQYRFTPRFSAITSATFARSTDLYSFGARFYF